MVINKLDWIFFISCNHQNNMWSNYPSGILEFSVKLWTLPHKNFYLCHCWTIILLGSFLFLVCILEHFSISLKVYLFHPNSSLFETIYSYWRAIYFLLFSHYYFLIILPKDLPCYYFQRLLLIIYLIWDYISSLRLRICFFCKCIVSWVQVANSPHTVGFPQMSSAGLRK